jgi:hypothetical protein
MANQESNQSSSTSDRRDRLENLILDREKSLQRVIDLQHQVRQLKEEHG